MDDIPSSLTKKTGRGNGVAIAFLIIIFFQIKDARESSTSGGIWAYWECSCRHGPENTAQESVRVLGISLRCLQLYQKLQTRMDSSILNVSSLVEAALGNSLASMYWMAWCHGVLAPFASGEERGKTCQHNSFTNADLPLKNSLLYKLVIDGYRGAFQYAMGFNLKPKG